MDSIIIGSSVILNLGAIFYIQQLNQKIQQVTEKYRLVSLQLKCTEQYAEELKVDLKKEIEYVAELLAQVSPNPPNEKE